MSVTIDRDALRAWVEATCAAQGVPVLVSDAAVIAQVGVLLTGGRPRGEPPAGGVARRAPSQSPGGDDPARV